MREQVPARVRMGAAVEDAHRLDEDLTRPVGREVGAGGDGGLLADGVSQEPIERFVTLHPCQPVGDDHL
ncbi:hypothetical protein Q2K19_32110 [Micromonospora soli]|uniref:hypothetical protein n=1 Tax=Micromonospora sp. NBRC 110009 TaxID=3061627 RepID=UPI0026722D9F|nr:hypothetical protein [Micromonospora sp. NBRC 110009]WKT98730.1 hypothetical protein Q2K19_32110 [Micromonospora sp. NBRC 110009]